jgi:hypothetical protein
MALGADLGDGRIKAMDDHGIDMQVLSSETTEVRRGSSGKTAR